MIRTLIALATLGGLVLLPSVTCASAAPQVCNIGSIKLSDRKLAQDAIAKQLGWVKSDENRCGGYYLEPPFRYPQELLRDNLIQYTNTGPSTFSLRGTSVLQGEVTVTRYGQQVTANKAYLYRNPTTGKISAIDLLGNVNLREPNTLVLAKNGHFDLTSKSQSLNDILYRTAIYNNKTKAVEPDNKKLQKARHVLQFSAWGQADTFSQTEKNVFELQEATYTTCPPDSSVWQVKAQHIELNKNTGRGAARHARLYIKKIPVLYTPYINFPIDNRRQTGFLWPTLGSDSSAGPYLGTPFYWNIAPNYDSTITPMYLGKRGLYATDLFRYLTPTSQGRFNLGFLPDDKAFSHFQTDMMRKFHNAPNPTQANLRILENDGSARGAFGWQDNSQFNKHWSSTVDYNYVTDDYYLRDLRNNLNEVTTNQLLQKADISYKGPNWNFTGRVQQYQTLHPVDQPTTFLNQYSRFPQLVLEGDYPDQAYGLNYFVMNDVTHFDIRDTPGTTTINPMGNRLHIQPGVSLPLNWPFLYVTPRIQFAATKYDLGHVTENPMHKLDRVLPIFDVGTGLYFDRDLQFFGRSLQQTLEPQIYYTYVPYRNQDQIPLFDTTLNTLTYDQLFAYNRFSGLDRMGDANQVAAGITTRFLDDLTGAEKMRVAVGQLFYFKNRIVTLCSLNTNTCPPDATVLQNNRLPRSPISGLLSYTLIPGWTVLGNTIWNTQTNKMDNQSITLQYKRDSIHLLNIGYNFVRNGDRLPSDPLNSPEANLKQIDLSGAWPVTPNWTAIGRWTKSINRGRFQNMLIGLQYDSCCWAIRVVGAKNFSHLDNMNVPQYKPEFFMQFALKGLGNISSRDPSALLSNSVSGYDSNFGQDF